MHDFHILKVFLNQFQVNIILPLFYLVICAFLIVLPLTTTPSLVGVAMLIISAGIPVYFVFIYWKGKPRCMRKIMRKYLYVIFFKIVRYLYYDVDYNIGHILVFIYFQILWTLPCKEYFWLYPKNR